jgi:hypothetical protein
MAKPSRAIPNNKMRFSVHLSDNTSKQKKNLMRYSISTFLSTCIYCILSTLKGTGAEFVRQINRKEDAIFKIQVFCIRNTKDDTFSFMRKRKGTKYIVRLPKEGPTTVPGSLRQKKGGRRWHLLFYAKGGIFFRLFLFG